MLSVVSWTSLMGTRSRERRVPTVRWVSGSKARIDSSASPKKSRRTGLGRPAGKRSMMPPRTAYSPVSRTVPVRRKPLASSQPISWVVSTTLPGAAEKVSAAMRAFGGTR